MLLNNRIARIYTIFKRILNVELPHKTKAEMVTLGLRAIAAKVTLTDDIALTIADLGFVHTADATDVVLGLGELVLLRCNSTLSTGEACVSPCQRLAGWVVRDGKPVFRSDLNEKQIYWAHLCDPRAT
jgi:hypothetical protein